MDSSKMSLEPKVGYRNWNIVLHSPDDDVALVGPTYGNLSEQIFEDKKKRIDGAWYPGENISTQAQQGKTIPDEIIHTGDGFYSLQSLARLLQTSYKPSARSIIGSIANYGRIVLDAGVTKGYKSDYAAIKELYEDELFEPCEICKGTLDSSFGSSKNLSIGTHFIQLGKLGPETVACERCAKLIGRVLPYLANSPKVYSIEEVRHKIAKKYKVPLVPMPKEAQEILDKLRKRVPLPY
jgi:hypothetical protein